MPFSTFGLMIRANRLRRDLMKPYYSRIGLTPLQISALVCIFDHPGRMQKEIAEDIGVSPTVLVGLLRFLEGKGLIACVRKNYNRRAIAVYSTEEGNKLVEIIRIDGERATSIALQGFSEEQITQLNDYLNRIVENCQTWQELH